MAERTRKRREASTRGIRSLALRTVTVSSDNGLRGRPDGRAKVRASLPAATGGGNSRALPVRRRPHAGLPRARTLGVERGPKVLLEDLADRALRQRVREEDLLRRLVLRQALPGEVQQ